MLATLILWAVLGLRSDWQPDACDHVFAYEEAKIACERTRDTGREWAEQIAEWVAEESTRQGMENIWDWIVADLKKEYDFERGNVCPIRIPLANVVSRELLDETAGRWKVCWTYQVYNEAPAARNCQPVLLLSEDETYLHVDRCAYGETGLFQIRTHEIPDHADTDVNGDGEIDRSDGGYVLPWGDIIPQTPAGRRESAHDPRTNIHLGMRALTEARDTCCEEGDDECKADPSKWLGMYNTGHCSGESSRNYVRRVRNLRDTAVEYVCEQMPEADVCQVEEEE